MASHSQRKLPNLKICVDNSKENESDSEESDQEESHIVKEPKEIKKEIINESESSNSSNSDGSTDTDSSSSSSDSSDNEHSDAESVEFNVRISGLSKVEKKSLKPKHKPEVLASKRYENKSGNFVTGIDLTSKEEIEKKDERAKRFGLTLEENKVKVDRQALLKSLGIKEEDITKGERGIRLEAIHMRGTDEMSTKDIFKYFSEFAPGQIEWIDDFSCNVIWFDPTTAARALICLTEDYETVTCREENREKEKSEVISPDRAKPDQASPVETTESADKPASTETEKPTVEKMEVDDDDLDLNADTDNESSDKEEKTKAKLDKSSADTEKENKPKDMEIENGEKTKDDKDQSLKEKQDGSEKRSKRKQESKTKIVWPPGKWRLGQPYAKAKHIFLRYATKADKKVTGAENKSKYYIKYGNPNYGGQKGLISGSRKRRYRAERSNEIKELVDEKSDGELSSSSEDKEETIRERPTQLFTNKNKVLPSTEDIDNLDMEAELQELLGPPVKKRSMRMYADDVEATQQARGRQSKGGLTIVTDARKGIEARLGPQLSDTRDARFRIVDARSKLSTKSNYRDLDLPSEDFDDFSSRSYSSPSSRSYSSSRNYSSSRSRSGNDSRSRSGNDLRSKLKNKKSGKSDHLSEIRIEVFE